MSIKINTPQDVIVAIAARARTARLALNLTQAALAERAGISLGSIKRFEHSGHISLISLLNVAAVLDHLEDFSQLFIAKQHFTSLDALLQENKQRKRGRLK